MTSFIYPAVANIYKLKVCTGSKSIENLKLLVNHKSEGKDGLTTPLVVASHDGHYQAVKHLITQCGADVEMAGSVTVDGETCDAPPLWCAAAAGHLNIVEYLIENNVNVDRTTSTHSTPLRVACVKGHLDIVECLLKHQANIDIANEHGHTSLMAACFKGHLDIAHFLLDAGANVNGRSTSGW